MRSRFSLWLAPAIIAVSLLLGFLLTRLLSGPAVAPSPAAQERAQTTLSPTPAARGLETRSGPAAAAFPPRAAVTQEPVSPTLDAASPASADTPAPGVGATQGRVVETGRPGQITISPGGPDLASASAPSQVLSTAEGADPSAPIGEIRIARIDLRAPIFEVSWHLVQIDGQTVAEWDTHPDGVGHHRGSSALGGDGHCVLSGHSRADGAGGVFQRLGELQVGDRIVLVDASGIETAYAVQEVAKVAELGATLEERRAHAAYMAPSQEARLTLITCWPDWAYTHRLIVIASRT